jgi:hypothetical protein
MEAKSKFGTRHVNIDGISCSANIEYLLCQDHFACIVHEHV